MSQKSVKSEPRKPTPGTRSRRSFLTMLGAGSALAVTGSRAVQEKVIQGFEKTAADPEASKAWKPIRERKNPSRDRGYIQIRR